MAAIIVFAVWIMGMCFLTSKVKEILRSNGCSDACETWVLIFLWIVGFIITAHFSNKLQSDARDRGFYEAMETRNEWDSNYRD